MKGKFFALVAISILPWLYLGSDLLWEFTTHMQGFGYLPFFALLLIKEKVFNKRGNRAEWSLISNSYLRNTILILATVFLTVLVVVVSQWISNIKSTNGGAWLWALFALVILALVSWDIKRAYHKNRSSA